jgi:hypothetical protein
MRWVARRWRSASSPATERVIRPAPARAEFGSMKSQACSSISPEDLFPGAHIRGSPEEPRVPIGAGVEIGYRDAGEEVGDRAHLREWYSP